MDIYQVGEPLPVPLEEEARERLSPEGREEIKRLMRADPLNFFFQLALGWGTIVSAILLAEYLESLWATALAVVFVATRQNILALLMHEQCHRIGFRSKWGDYLCNFTCAYPLLVSVEGYRRVHLAHHQCFFTDKDPDYRRKQGKEWTFPQRAAELLKTLVVDLLGLNLWSAIKGKRASDGPAAQQDTSPPLWVRGSYYALLALFFTWMNLWPIFLIYWFLPLATVFQVIMRWGAICEHRYNLIHPTLGESTPIIETRWWERLLLPNLDFTMHIYHHWYPAISHSKLLRVHDIFRREGLLKEENVFRGYGTYLRFLLRKPKLPARKGTAEQLAPNGTAH